MIAGIGCSTVMIEALLSLPPHAYSRVEAALEFAFAFPNAVDEHLTVEARDVDLHLIVAKDILFIIAEAATKVRLLQVTLFRPDGQLHTIH